jgi:hypothetical protein
MGKYTSIVAGAIVALLGLLGIIAWRCDFITILKGSVPALLLLGGAIAVIAGLSEIKDEAASKKDEAASKKDEAASKKDEGQK